MRLYPPYIPSSLTPVSLDRSGRGIPETHVPAAYGKLWFTEHEWGMKTEPQTHAGGRTIFWPRGPCILLHAHSHRALTSRACAFVQQSCSADVSAYNHMSTRIAH